MKKPIVKARKFDSLIMDIFENGNQSLTSLSSAPPTSMRFVCIRLRRRRAIFSTILTILFLELLWNLPWTPLFTRPLSSSLFPQDLGNQLEEDIPITVVIAALKKDNLTLLEQESGLRPGDEQIVYVADDPSAVYRVPVNKGNEAMVYLSFLIDRYDTLPDLMVFMHAGRSSWHNNILLRWDSARMIVRLRRSYIRSKGFTNLLCDETYQCTHVYNATDSGYPAFILTRVSKHRPGEGIEVEYAQFREIWGVIFPGQPVPLQIGTVPGAQFALTREAARNVPLNHLKRLRQWIIDVDLDAQSAGMVFERLWHMIFLGTSNPIHCPVSHHCYCSLYGVCLESITDAQSSPEEIVTHLTSSGRLIRGEFNRLERIRYIKNQDAMKGRDHELAVLSAGHIGPGLVGLSEYTALLEKNITEFTCELDEIVRKATSAQ
jgi:Protein of unknown function (DUF3431)